MFQLLHPDPDTEKATALAIAAIAAFILVSIWLGVVIVSLIIRRRQRLRTEQYIVIKLPVPLWTEPLPKRPEPVIVPLTPFPEQVPEDDEDDRDPTFPPMPGEVLAGGVVQDTPPTSRARVIGSDDNSVDPDAKTEDSSPAILDDPLPSPGLFGFLDPPKKHE